LSKKIKQEQDLPNSPFTKNRSKIPANCANCIPVGSTGVKTSLAIKNELKQGWKPSTQHNINIENIGSISVTTEN